MMDFYKRNAVLTVLLLAILLPFNMGCNRIFRRPDEGQSKQSQQSQGQKKSPPKTLTSLEDTTEMMIEDIQKVKDKRAEAAQQKQEKSQEEQENSQNTQGQGDKSKEKQPEQGEQKSQEETKSKDQKSNQKESKSTTVDWNKMQKNVEKLQTSWSDYINTAIKDGASNELIRDYGNQLDVLTTKVMEQQEDSLLDAANDLYKYYAKFFNLYKHQAPPNVKDIKYYVRKVIIDSENGQWSQNRESIDSMKQAWETAKSRMEKPDPDMNRKIQATMDSFFRSVQQQNKHLIKMKGDILIKSLEEIK